MGERETIPRKTKDLDSKFGIRIQNKSPQDGGGRGLQRGAAFRTRRLDAMESRC